ncbi:hypothetical protein [Cryobacterium roopkundense]|uniref:Thiol:disulfide interchange protein n=1 Tax=Cryobacterium roopkundense TaxID=1001240 RepID=A0A7W9E4B1_9MICO|nr:hypothetical protein [Cryobacterium roopkundense]MBB5641244.1 thiol:disulfide interchange protein [Cryobacterium roopkundense]
MNVVAFIIALAVFILGFWLFGLAFTVTALQGPIFIAGIVAICVSLAIPFHWLRN